MIEDRGFEVRLWDGTVVRGTAPVRFTLVLRDPASLGDMLTIPLERSLATAYLRDRFDVEGDMIAAFRTFETLAQLERSVGVLARFVCSAFLLPRTTLGPATPPGRARLWGVAHSRRRDRSAIRHHYDIGNEFFALWLDERMQYSCAYFERASLSLDEAQRAKLDLVCRKLRLAPGERLLDIGCGWGGLALHAAREYGARVVGVTLSGPQAVYARREAERAGLSDRVEIREQDYRDVQDGPFDKIASVGMFEHVGRTRLPSYFRAVRRLLAPGGLFLNHGISLMAPSMRRWSNDVVRRPLVGAGWFIPNYVFPDGELVPLSEVNLLAEREGLEVRDVENLREHYALTLRHWVDRLETHHKEAVSLTSERTYRTWRLYMAGSAGAFERGRISINQTLLAAATPEGHVHIPRTRADLYLPARAAEAPLPSRMPGVNAQWISHGHPFRARAMASAR